MSVNSYVFRHQNAILSESIKTKEHKSKTPIQVSIALTVIISTKILKFQRTHGLNYKLTML
jgi:hypothetical protein